MLALSEQTRGHFESGTVPEGQPSSTGIIGRGGQADDAIVHRGHQSLQAIGYGDTLLLGRRGRLIDLSQVQGGQAVHLVDLWLVTLSGWANGDDHDGRFQLDR